MAAAAAATAAARYSLELVEGFDAVHVACGASQRLCLRRRGDLSSVGPSHESSSTIIEDSVVTVFYSFEDGLDRAATAAGGCAGGGSGVGGDWHLRAGVSSVFDVSRAEQEAAPSAPQGQKVRCIAMSAVCGVRHTFSVGELVEMSQRLCARGLYSNRTLEIGSKGSEKNMVLGGGVLRGP